MSNIKVIVDKEKLDKLISNYSNAEDDFMRGVKSALNSIILTFPSVDIDTSDESMQDEKEQAIKRGGEIYAEHYIEGVKDGISKINI